MNIYDYVFRDNNGKDIVLSNFQDKNILIVNTASNCGFTKQYSELQEISSLENIEVIAFPCNQFGSQEPGNDNDIKEFCTTNYGVTFTVALKVDVNGELAHPLFIELKDVAKNGQDIGWNFEKFLIKTDGSILNFAPDVTPKKIVEHI
jgi:glutathione peroxidase